MLLATPIALARPAEPVKECPADQRLAQPRELTAPPDEGTLVVIPDECQSMPMTAPKDWNQNGWARRRRNSSRP